MQLTKLPTETQAQYVERIWRAYQKELDLRNNYNARELLILHTKEKAILNKLNQHK